VTRLKATNVHVLRTDGVACLRQLSESSVDLIFIDPPFDGALFEPALQAAGKAVKADGFVYLEAPLAWTDEQLAPMGLSLHRHLKAGAVHAHLLRRIA
jgi:16S rRNA G966 N2-methylase RsmD